MPIIAQYIYDGEDLGHPYISFMALASTEHSTALLPWGMRQSHRGPHPSDYTHKLSAY